MLRLDLAQQSTLQLLPAFNRGTKTTRQAQSVSATVWVLAELRMSVADSQVSADSTIACSFQVVQPPANCTQLVKVVFGCAQLGYRNGALKQRLLQSSHQIQQEATGSGGRFTASDADSLAAMCWWAVSILDMPQLAAAAVELVVTSGVGQRLQTHPSNLRRLWESRAWLLQHRLLNVKGSASTCCSMGNRRPVHVPICRRFVWY